MVMSKMRQAVIDADVVLCWNSRFEEADNKALFEFVAQYMVKANAVFVCTTLPPVHVDLHEIFIEGMAPKSDVAYCCSSVDDGTIAGHRKSNWFNVFQLGGPDSRTRRTTRQAQKTTAQASVLLARSLPPKKKARTSAQKEETKTTSAPKAPGPGFTLAETALKTSPNGIVVGFGWTPSIALAQMCDVEKPYSAWSDPKVTTGSIKLGLGGDFCYRPVGTSEDGFLCPPPVLPDERQFVFGGVIRNAVSQSQEGHLDLFHNGPVTMLSDDGSIVDEVVYTDGKLVLSDLQQAFAVIAPFQGGPRIALEIWDWTLAQWQEVFVDPEKKEFFLFDPTILWHRGDGIEQGARLYVMYLPKDSVVPIPALIHDGKRVLRETDVGGRPLRQHATSSKDGGCKSRGPMLKVLPDLPSC
jgi:hypothetical protein